MAGFGETAIASVGVLALALAATAQAAGSAPPLGPKPRGPKPTFRPGLYETETRTAAHPDRGETTIGCLSAADFDAFRRETIARYLEAPQFRAVCRLSGTKPIVGGFAFAMDCDQATSIISFTFAEDLVTSVTETTVLPRPEYASRIVTLSRRIGACRDRKPGPRT